MSGGPIGVSGNGTTNLSYARKAELEKKFEAVAAARRKLQEAKDAKAREEAQAELNKALAAIPADEAKAIKDQIIKPLNGEYAAKHADFTDVCEKIKKVEKEIANLREVDPRAAAHAAGTLASKERELQGLWSERNALHEELWGKDGKGGLTATHNARNGAQHSINTSNSTLIAENDTKYAANDVLYREKTTELAEVREKISRIDSGLVNDRGGIDELRAREKTLKGEVDSLVAQNQHLAWYNGKLKDGQDPAHIQDQYRKWQKDPVAMPSDASTVPQSNTKTVAEIAATAVKEKESGADWADASAKEIFTQSGSLAGKDGVLKSGDNDAHNYKTLLVEGLARLGVDPTKYETLLDSDKYDANTADLTRLYQEEVNKVRAKKGEELLSVDGMAGQQTLLSLRSMEQQYTTAGRIKPEFRG